MRFDKLRGMRYSEVFFNGGDASTHDLKVNFYDTTDLNYDTTDLNNTQDPRDTCPAAIWAEVNTEALSAG